MSLILYPWFYLLSAELALALHSLHHTVDEADDLASHKLAVVEVINGLIRRTH